MKKIIKLFLRNSFICVIFARNNRKQKSNEESFIIDDAPCQYGSECTV